VSTSGFSSTWVKDEEREVSEQVRRQHRQRGDEQDRLQQGKSWLWIAWNMTKPTPGKEKTFSTRSDPLTTRPSSIANPATAGRMALRAA